MSVTVEIEIPLSEINCALNKEAQKVKVATRRTSEALGKRGVQLFQGVTRRFRHKVDFTTITNESGDAVEVVIGTDDKIFGYLDKGTSVRYALMSPDFVAKTQPGSLKAGSGRGGVVIINRNRPRPGIRARNFTGQVEIILKREAEPTFSREYRRVR